MSTGATALGAGRSTTFTDPTRAGSKWQQAGVGFVGIVLAIVLVVGQVSVATTAGIQHNVRVNIDNLRKGNATMREVIKKAAPTVVMEQVVGEQRKTLAHTNTTMGTLNRELAGIGATTNKLSTTVGRMQANSHKLTSGVEGMSADTSRIVKLLGGLPAATDSTHVQLKRISTDTGAINGELTTIAKRMEGYGLPHAKHVKGAR